MRRAFVGAALFALMAAPGFSEQTWTGKISDSMCGATHKMAAEHGTSKMSDRECTEACIKGGGKYVFVSNGKVYPIENQDYSGLAEHAGHTVKLMGDMQSQGSIKVTDIKMVKKVG
jgi:hypothetical protein